MQTLESFCWKVFVMGWSCHAQKLSGFLPLPEVQRARERQRALSEAVSGPGCCQGLTIDNTTLTVGHRVKTQTLRTIIMEAKGSPARMVSIHLLIL